VLHLETSCLWPGLDKCRPGFLQVHPDLFDRPGCRRTKRGFGLGKKCDASLGVRTADRNAKCCRGITARSVFEAFEGFNLYGRLR
jgi:hypothetical protein